MTARTLGRIAVALVVALVLWGLAEIFTGRGDGLEGMGLLEAVTPAQITAIEFVRPTEPLRLERSGERWTVNGFDASPQAVDEFLAALTDSVRGEQVARNPSAHAELGVDSANATRLRVQAGGRVAADLWVGKRGRGSASVYVRPAADDRTYLLEGGLAPLLERTLADWRDKRIADVPPDSVARLTIVRGPVSYTLERRDTVWTFPDGRPTDTPTVERIVNALHPLAAQGAGFATPAEAASADFQQPDRRLTLYGRGGQSLAALAFDSTESGFWVRRADGGTVYQLMQWKVDEITPSDATVRR